MARRGLLALGFFSLVIATPASAAITPVVTDGWRYAAYAPSKSVTRVLDTRDGTAFNVRTPPGCYPRFGDTTGGPYLLERASGGIDALGSGRLMWDCEQKALVMDLRSRRITEPLGANVGALMRQNGGTFISYWLADIGTRWIRVMSAGAHEETYPQYLDLTTGALKQQALGARAVANLDSPALVQPLCDPLRRGLQAFDVGMLTFVPGDAAASYERPYLLAFGGPAKFDKTSLYLARCGSAQRKRLSVPTEHARDAQLGGGIVTWTTRYGKVVHIRVLRSGRTTVLRVLPAARRVSHTANRVFVSSSPRGTSRWTIHTLRVHGSPGPRPAEHGGTPVTPAR